MPLRHLEVTVTESVHQEPSVNLPNWGVSSLKTPLKCCPGREGKCMIVQIHRTVLTSERTNFTVCKLSQRWTALGSVGMSTGTMAVRRQRQKDSRRHPVTSAAPTPQKCLIPRNFYYGKFQIYLTVENSWFAIHPTLHFFLMLLSGIFFKMSFSKCMLVFSNIIKFRMSVKCIWANTLGLKEEAKVFNCSHS